MDKYNRLAIMQPYLFPYIGYFQLIYGCDAFILYDDVQFIRGRWINRNFIASFDKKILFTLPVMKGRSTSLICDVKCSSYLRWRDRFLRQLQYVYGKAPFFGETISLLTECLPAEAVYLKDVLYSSLKSTCEYLKIETPLIESSGACQHIKGKREARILDICSHYQVKSYINAPGGIGLYRAQDFKERKVNLFFLKPEQVPYRRESGTWFPFLSIIDVLMYNETDLIMEQFLPSYELEECV